MPIISSSFNDVGNAGQVPNLVRIETDDSLATILTTGYLNALAHQNLPLSENSVVLVSTGSGVNKAVSAMRMVFSSGDWSLELLQGYQESLDNLTLPSVTAATNDKVLIQDTSDSNILKTTTVQSILDLAPGGSGVFTQIKTTVTSPQILDMLNTPVLLIPAPGAGKIILVTSVTLIGVFGTANYTGGDVLAVSYDGFDGISFYEDIPATAVTGQNKVTVPVPIAYPNVVNQNIIVDQGIYIWSGGVTPFATGDGTLDVYLTYQTITI